MAQVHRITVVTQAPHEERQMQIPQIPDTPMFALLKKLQTQVVRISFFLMAVIVSIHLASLILPREVTKNGPSMTLLLVMWAPWCGYQGSRMLNPALIKMFISCNTWTLLWLLASVAMQIPLYTALLRGEVAKEDDDENTVVLPPGYRDEVLQGLIVYGVLLLILAVGQVIAIVYGFKLYHETARQQAHIVMHRLPHFNTEEFAGQPVGGLEDLLALITAGGQAEDGPRGLNQSIVDNYPLKKLSEQDLESDPSHNLCVICQDDYEVGTLIRTLPCQHKYHDDCISKWLRRSVNCPICNRDLSVDSAADSQEIDEEHPGIREVHAQLPVQSATAASSDLHLNVT